MWTDLRMQESRLWRSVFSATRISFPSILEIVKERWHLDTKTPVPWVRVYYVPDHVKFNHQPHIRAGIDCAACHGEVKRYDRLMKVDFKMAFCVDCHKQKNAPLDCWLACHH